MITCIILHNMIVKDEYDYDAVDDYEALGANRPVEAGAEDEFHGQRGHKYRPVVNNDRAVLEMSPMDPSSSSSSSSSLPVHQASLKYVCFLYLRLRDLNGGLRMNFDALCFWFNGLIVENELNPQVHLMI
ncbi:hypothetical protein TB2_043245 [Malus domestica]|uniref:Uncharacterized protein n=1 Tax=Malus domestica TaxID=3750 RepID=A0A498JA89_MALDO|nr:hypothetical protein DVH24_020778 [Malus domestica]